MPTVREAYLLGREHLAVGGSAAPSIEAEVLLRYVLAVDRARLYAAWEADLPAEAWARYQHLLEVRAQGRPLHYILGEREFMGLSFAVDERVMIPRPETEVLVEHLIGCFQFHPGPMLVDVGTGSGCIGISLAHFLPRARILAIDLSAAALEVARANATRHALADRVTFLEGDLLRPLPEALRGQIDAIASNPPYIPLEQAAGLPKEIREYEPPVALFAPGGGMEFHRRLIAESPPWLAAAGMVALEVALGQAPTVADVMRQDRRYAPIQRLSDLAGVERVVVGVLASAEGARPPRRN